MLRSLLIAAAFTVGFSVAAQAKTCVIVYANDRGHNEIRWHEMAHCFGWTHPATPSSKSFMGGRRSYDPPPRLRGRLYEPRIEHPVSSKEAVEICGGHIGCQWFE